MESNELRLRSERKETKKDFKIQNLERKPRKQQKRLPLSSELKNAMQDRQWKRPTIQQDLESIRKFSILHCIRERVFEVLSKLPLVSIECLCQEDIDGLIRRNLLRDRKVRFSRDDEYEGEPKLQKTQDEIEKENILEEMEVVLKVLGNDRNNQLIIENFELLEQRIERVEQRLSGLVRKLPSRTETLHSQIKIDVKHVRQDLQHFVDKFNQVFTHNYDKPTDMSVPKQTPRQSLSSTHRLKFQILSRIMDQNIHPVNETQEPKPKESDDCEVVELSQEIEQTTSNDPTELDAKESTDKFQIDQIDQHALKAVDSLITLRERFKAQSVKWLKMKSDKRNEQANNLGKTRLKELYLSTERKITEEPIFELQKAKEIKELETTKTELVKTQHIPEEHKKSEAHKTEPLKIQGVKEFRRDNEQHKNFAKYEHQKVSTTTLKTTTNVHFTKKPRELSYLEKATKSVQTITKLKKRKTRSRSNKKQKALEPEEPKEIVVQYVNKKVLRNTNSTMAFKELKKFNELKETSIKNEKETSKPEKTRRKSKQIKDTSPATCSKVNLQVSPKEPAKKADNSTLNSKRYKKIFLFKLPKSSSKQHAIIRPKKNEIKDLNDAKESKKSIEKGAKRLSLIKIFPKPSKLKSKEEKQIKEKKLLQKPGIKSTISNDSLVKAPAIFDNSKKFRSTWIYAEDQGELVQKRMDDNCVNADPASNNNAKKSINKLINKSKKS